MLDKEEEAKTAAVMDGSTYSSFKGVMVLFQASLETRNHWK